MKQLSFGGKNFTEPELRRLANITYRAELTKMAGDELEDETIATLREVRQLFPGYGATKNINGLWHWFGGDPATAADLLMLTSWLSSEFEVIRRISTDPTAHRRDRDGAAALVYHAMLTGGPFASAAERIADLLDGVAAAAAGYIGYNEETGEFDDPSGLLTLFRASLLFAKCLHDGPDGDGRYLEDDLVWNVLAGASPHGQ